MTEPFGTKPSLMIATPAYGGLLTHNYVSSLVKTLDWASQEQVQVAFHCIANESFIGRGRDSCAKACLDHKFDKLLFIDADIGWTAEDVSRLYYSDKRIVGGLYPHKAYPIKINLNKLPNVKPDERNEVPVLHIATGFLKIDASVFEELKPEVPTYVSNHMSGNLETYWQFFGSGVSRLTKEYMTEDWFFCELAARSGILPHANLDCILTHTGTHTFAPSGNITL